VRRTRATTDATERPPHARVAVIFTGGTISMRLDPATGAAVPALSGAEILALTPGLDEIAEVEPIDWGLVPASHLSFAQILEIARLLDTALRRPDVDGAVVVQGTDTIEETAFAYDLLVASDKPVVVVGAMRNADHPEYDGPRNLSDAVRVAADPAVRGVGTVVVMNGDILPADDATKTHTDTFDAFRAPNAGPLGRVEAGTLRLARGPATAPPSRRRIDSIPETAAEPIWIVPASVGADGGQLRAAIAAGVHGIVVAATGAGNTHPDMLVAAKEAMAAGIPVVLTTRAVSGQASGAYGFPGGGATWLAAGAIRSGTLSAPSARVALALGLGAGLDDAGLRALLAG
jgi:L-asparaginase